MKKFTDKQLLVIGCSILFVTFITGIIISYNQGFYYGALKVCEPLIVGVDQNGEYSCFDEQESLLQAPEIEFNTNITLQEVKWH